MCSHSISNICNDDRSDYYGCICCEKKCDIKWLVELENELDEDN